MKYDRDLKRFRAGLAVMAAANAAMSVLCAVRHEWLTAGASAVWAGSMAFTLLSARTQQRTRDKMGADIEEWRAAWRAMMAEAAAAGGKEALGAAAVIALQADEVERKRAERMKHWLN